MRYSQALNPRNRLPRQIEREIEEGPQTGPLYRDSSHTFVADRHAHRIKLDAWGSGRLAILTMRLLEPDDEPEPVA